MTPVLIACSLRGAHLLGRLIGNLFQLVHNKFLFSDIPVYNDLFQ